MMCLGSERTLTASLKSALTNKRGSQIVHHYTVPDKRRLEIGSGEILEEVAGMTSEETVDLITSAVLCYVRIRIVILYFC